ncbi:MAG: terminase small subunit [Clostridia bacterium]|nr:terminase small subunit [Clostridia bacterium]
MLKNLTRERFCMEYVRNGHNATKAAIAAGYSEKSAYSQGSRLLKNEEIAERIRQIEGDLLNELGITQTSVLEELMELLKKCVSEELIERPAAEKPELTERRYRRLDVSGATKILELLGKQLGMFGEKISADVTQTMSEGDRRLIENIAARIERE